MEDTGTLVQGVPGDQQIFVRGDLDGHVGKDTNSFSQIHRGYGYDTRNNKRKAIVDFV